MALGRRYRGFWHSRFIRWVEQRGVRFLGFLWSRRYGKDYKNDFWHAVGPQEGQSQPEGVAGYGGDNRRGAKAHRLTPEGADPLKSP